MVSGTRAKRPLAGRMFCTIDAAAAMCERAVQAARQERAEAMQGMARAFEERIAGLEARLAAAEGKEP